MSDPHHRDAKPQDRCRARRARRCCVWADRTEGTIGGGTLEWEAMAEARAMLADGRQQPQCTIPLGPALGQCCGGSVTPGCGNAGGGDDTTRSAVRCGFTGRAMWAAPLSMSWRRCPILTITWVDTGADRFPETDVTTLVATDPALSRQTCPG